MIRVIAAAVFTSHRNRRMPRAASSVGGMITQVAYGCGASRTRVHGVCVARTTKRHVRREVRRCARWHGGTCVRWY